MGNESMDVSVGILLHEIYNTWTRQWGGGAEQRGWRAMEERHVARGVMAGTTAREETSEPVGTTGGRPLSGGRSHIRLAESPSRPLLGRRRHEWAAVAKSSCDALSTTHTSLLNITSRE